MSLKQETIIELIATTQKAVIEISKEVEKIQKDVTLLKKVLDVDDS